MKYLEKYDLVLNEIVAILKSKNISLSKNNADGRINSVLNEDEVIKILLEEQDSNYLLNKMELKIEKAPKPRYWYDFLIKNNSNNFFCPINIKITNLNNNSNDNISSKEGLYFSLTGINGDQCPNNWGDYFESLSSRINETNMDYYFLIIDKNNNDIFYNSMKRLKTLTANGNNLPFQCKWKENREIIERNFEESKKFLLHYLSLSVKKRAQILEEFKRVFNRDKKDIDIDDNYKPER